MEGSSFCRQVTTDSSLQQDWICVQDLLKGKLVLQDDFTWTISSEDSCSEKKRTDNLRYIGGVDVSYLKEYPSLACGALVVIDAYTSEVVHEEYEVVQLDIPYVPGFLAFREAPVLLGLLDKMKNKDYPYYPQLLMVDGNGLLHPRGVGLACHLGVMADIPSIGVGKNAPVLLGLLDKMKNKDYPYYPQLLMVDGNGLLHPRGVGLACHLGVMADIPSIGVGKNLHLVDGLTQSGVRQLLEARKNFDKDMIPLVGKTGQVWGVAMCSTTGSSKPIYISVGHRISLNSSCKIVKMFCKFRVPEPIRQADIRSRSFLQKMLRGQLQV